MKLSAPHSSAAIKNQWNRNSIPTYVPVVSTGTLKSVPHSREEHRSAFSCLFVCPHLSVRLPRDGFP